VKDAAADSGCDLETDPGMDRRISEDAGPESLDLLLLHTPKFKNFYRPIGEFSFILYPPIGLLGLAHFLTQRGHPTRTVHLGVEKYLRGSLDFDRILDENRTPLVGIDLHWHFQAWDAIETAREIKRRRPNVAIVLGGFTASLFADEILHDFPSVDFVIRGDGEIPLLDLIRALKGNQDYRPVANLSWRDGSVIVHNPMDYAADDAMLEEISFTDFSLMKDAKCFIESFSRFVRTEGQSERLQRLMFAKSRAYPVFVGRGCPHECSYCGGSREAHALICGRKRAAVRSAHAIVSSIRDLDRLGFDCAGLNHDVFPPATADETYVRVFDKIAALNLAINLEVERYFLPTERFVESFSRLPGKDSYITLSPNSHSEEIRKSNGLYRYSNAEFEECLEITDRYGVNVLVFYACGLPFETRKDLDEMAEYQRRLRKRFKRVRIRTGMIEIEPGSPMSRLPEKYGIEPERRSFADYYRYHSEPGNSHFLALGYSREGCPEFGPLSSYYCSHFCGRFGAGWRAPVLCKTFAALRGAGALRIVDWAVNLRKAERESAPAKT
jgi:radical SAM superfamily enzyme YgiQ (UPF0313 family)